MNKILVSSNSIISDSSKVKIDGNNIILLEDDMYLLEYEDINNIELNIISKNIVATLFESGFLNDINVNNKYIVDGGNLKINKFYNNDSVNEKIVIDLYSSGEINYMFSNICKNKEDYEININHKGIGTVSNISNKSISLDGANLSFVINSNVAKEFIKSKLDQNTRIVTLGASDAKVSPNMFIDCDDIEAKHGSVIGTFKDDMIFYLMSRGISYNDAIKLLVKGYLFSNIDVDSVLRERILNVIDTYWR